MTRNPHRRWCSPEKYARASSTWTGRLDRLEQAPTGDDYNALYQLANGGLIDLLKTLGDPTDFGD